MFSANGLDEAACEEHVLPCLVNGDPAWKH